MLDLDDVKGNNRDRRPSMGDLVSVFKFPEKKWVTLRLLTGMQAEAGYWVKTKKKDGKQIKFYVPCPSFDPESQERDSTKCDPWRDLQLKEAAAVKDGDLDKDDAKVQFGQHFWMNAIIRSEQKKKPGKVPKPGKDERASGFKDKDSDSWTPVMVVKIGRSLAGKIQELKGLNTVESKKTGAVKAYSVNDPKFGRDIRIYFDGSKAPADKYQVQLGDKRTPLDEDEEAYLRWDMSGITGDAPSDKEITADFESWASRNGVTVKSKDSGKGKKSRDEDDEDEDDEEEDEKPAKKSKGKKPAKGKKSQEDDEDDDDFDDEDDEDEKPAKKSKKKSSDEDDDFDDEDEKPAKKSKKKSTDDDEDEEDSDDEEDEDEDEEDSDDEEDEDEDDDFDDEDEKPSKKSSKKPVKKPSKKSSDDEDDFDDEDDEDEKPAKKSKKKSSDEDDDFDDEDEKPSKKSKGKKSSKGKAKKSSDDEDDDFDD